MTKQNLPIKPYPLGAHCEAGIIRFSLASKKADCGIMIYDRATGKRKRKIAFTPGERIGNVYCKYVEENPAEITYLFYEGEQLIPDIHARMFPGRTAYGKERDGISLRAGFPQASFDWEGDVRPLIPIQDCLVYSLHVRGFTRHASSGVACPGTFRGMVEKLPYLKECGITTLELQPAYEFLEIPSREERRKEAGFLASEEDLDKVVPKKLNYWGYKEGFYYAPKAAYASQEDSAGEFKEMVKAFHRAGMEVVMQFYFPASVNQREIPEILRYWVLEYHVDGFHLMGENLPVEMIAGDDALADTKLWYYDFDVNRIYQKDEVPAYRNLASCREDYQYVMRSFLKGDEGLLNEVLRHMRMIPEKTGRIHYLSCYSGLTMMDLVSYDRKHNEGNGEENRDGTDYNCSWNCGEEGPTRKKRILALRMQQYKNALCILLLTQSTPLLFMGDEFGNSQKGNNNPYCQDNSITWLNWKDLEKNRELHSFFLELVALRGKHPILHPSRELRIMDYLSCGYPDLSYHGNSAWRPQMELYSRQVGVMLCGKYIKQHDKEDAFLYLAINMHWEPHELALPRLPKELCWEMVCSTRKLEEDKWKERPETAELPNELCRSIPGRSIVIFIGKDKEKEQEMTKNE